MTPDARAEFHTETMAYITYTPATGDFNLVFANLKAENTPRVPMLASHHTEGIELGLFACTCADAAEETWPYENGTLKTWRAALTALAELTMKPRKEQIAEMWPTTCLSSGKGQCSECCPDTPGQQVYTEEAFSVVIDTMIAAVMEIVKAVQAQPGASLEEVEAQLRGEFNGQMQASIGVMVSRLDKVLYDSMELLAVEFEAHGPIQGVDAARTVRRIASRWQQP